MRMIKRIAAGGLLFFLILQVDLMPAAQVKLPGSLVNFISYLKSYSATEKNFIYYLNDTLLFEQMPDLEKIRERALQGVINLRQRQEIFRGTRKLYKNNLKMTLNHRIKRIVSSHRTLKEYLAQLTKDPEKPVSLDLNHPQEYLEAELLLKLTGLMVQKDSTHGYRLKETYSAPDFEPNHYYQLLGINPWTLEKKLNQTRRFDLEMREFEVTIPWDFDFLRQITGLEINPDSFAEILTQDKRFQLFLGILYRLSDKEINYISGLGPDFAAWKKIYSNNKFLCGMFILSHALRVKNNRLQFPGDPDPNAALFWKKSVGIDYLQYPLQFLEQLAVKDGGKLNYFYVFTFFLPGEMQKAVLFNFDHQKFREIYYLVELDKKEKIRGLEIPVLKNLGFFTLIYALKTHGGEIIFPGGIDAWTNAVGAPGNSWFALLKHLLTTSKKNHSLNRFIPIYSKFFHRREILIEEVIRAFYENYLEYNVVIDFIEKIPLKKPKTVLALLFWAKSLENADISKRKKEAVIAVFQSLLEILSQKARTMPTQYPYDQLVEELIQIPLSGASLYDGVFRFFASRLDIDLTGSWADQSFWDFLLPANLEVVVYNQAYQLETAPILKKEIAKALESQSSTSLSHLVKINRLLEALQASNSDRQHKKIGKQLFGLFQQLSLAEEIDENLSQQLRDILETHASDRLFENLYRLVSKKLKKAPQSEIDKLVEKIKSESLLQELEHYLLTCIYAVTLKNSKLQVFLNPNLTRFHDFSSHQGKTPWNHSGISQRLGNLAAYHLEGGLSRLNITLAFPYSEFTFGREIGYNSTQGVPIIFNHLDLFPGPLIYRAQEYNGLLVKFAEELLQQSWENPTLKEALKHELMTMTAGYHYRTVMHQLEKPKANPKTKFNQPILYFSELQRLGEVFFKKRKFIERFSQNRRLEAFREPLLYQAVQEEMNRLGSIYYHTFGTLKPYRYSLFPQSLSLVFESHWTCAEMIDELKVKAAYIFYLRKMPPQLLGGIVYRYVFLAADFLFRNSRIDYHSTYFMYSVFNYLYLHQIYNDLRKQGILRIK
ncbi:MAG: hypothetical protein JSV88_33285 [Candidatus Aminicenantes bacterium]|nr:MAG: hypothetical protein JSV88_33285 [Candidatus Aminicenantes bacterium]